MKRTGIIIWDLFKYIFGYFLFWLVLCFFDRLIFLGTFLFKQSDLAFSEVIASFWHGAQMDLSLAAYLSVLPFILFFLSLFFSSRNRNSTRISPWFIRLYTYMMVVVFVTVSAVNLVLYLEWSEKITYKAIDLFLLSPREALASVQTFFIIFAALIVLMVIWITILFFHKLFSVRRPASIQRFPLSLSIPLFILTAIGLFTCIRGGYGRAPMNPSMAYYSDKPFLNHAAVSTHWYLMDDMLNYKSSRHPFEFMKTDEVDVYLKELYPNPDSSSVAVPKLFEIDRPNVILIIVEGFTAGLIQSLGGEAGVTPRFEELISEGLLFDQIYSVAERSDKGIVGLLSGFPAQGTQSIVRAVNKAEKLPVIAEEFSREGYSTSFYYGGQSEFYNLKSYVLTHDYNYLVDLDNFPNNSIKSSWGVYDEVLFDRHLADLSMEVGAASQPFFSTVYTLTNHHPFELPEDYKFGRNGMGNQFRSTTFYTDSVLHGYLLKAKSQPWYDETIFVIVADHGHRLPDDSWNIHEPERHHIPLLIYGAPLQQGYRGQRISKIGSQTDLPATLLYQMGWEADRYHWSKNLLNDSLPGSAFYNWADGFGLLTESGLVTYDFIGNQIINIQPEGMSNEETEWLLRKGKATLQRVFDEYLLY